MDGPHEPTSKTIDVIVIGGGIAGCYAAYRLRQRHAGLHVLVIEAGDRLGGRAQTDTFHGVSVTTGAGFGRFGKDILLRRLMTELKLWVSPFISGHNVLAANDVTCHVETDFKALRRQYVNQQKAARAPLHATFKQFASMRLSDYDTFVACTGFSDFEKADAADVFFNYGFEDNYMLWPAFTVPWSNLISAMMRDIPYVLDTRLQKFHRTPSGTFALTCVRKDTTVVQLLHAATVVITTDGSALQALLPTYSHLYRHIHGQPFIKIYGAFDAPSVKMLSAVLPKKGLTVFPGSPLQKMIHVSGGVYLMAYSDNANALALLPLSRNDGVSHRVLCRLVEAAVRLPANTLRLLSTRTYFWAAGTHYYDPFATGPHRSTAQFIEAAQRPMPGVFVAGECVALHQGWVEGALESVEAILKTF